LAILSVVLGFFGVALGVMGLLIGLLT